ncbi:BnaC04g31500D [Brassica napus]|uniref:BnaC04g31500D protein n=2 Tax=Brassiceae TaxID=981071 RepID=A0A078GYK8_BRANA|nr:BnaC04g31500D [Brassica napus]
MFVWKETKTVLTLQRLNLEELLKKGVCVSPLPPCLNFTYLTKSHTNVFASGQRTS